MGDDLSEAKLTLKLTLGVMPRDLLFTAIVLLLSFGSTVIAVYDIVLSVILITPA
jgi:hypothetical protein